MEHFKQREDRNVSHSGNGNRAQASGLDVKVHQDLSILERQRERVHERERVDGGAEEENPEADSSLSVESDPGFDPRTHEPKTRVGCSTD